MLREIQYDSYWATSMQIYHFLQIKYITFKLIYGFKEISLVENRKKHETDLTEDSLFSSQPLFFYALQHPVKHGCSHQRHHLLTLWTLTVLYWTLFSQQSLHWLNFSQSNGNRNALLYTSHHGFDELLSYYYSWWFSKIMKIT